MYSNRIDLEGISSSLDEMLGYLDRPGVTEDDYVSVAKKIRGVIDVLVGYMKSNYSKVSGLQNHNRMYWWTYMGEVSRALYGMGYCAYKTNNFDGVLDWMGLAATANSDERFIKDCDNLCAAAAREQGKLMTRTLAEFSSANKMDINQRAGEVISALV